MKKIIFYSLFLYIISTHVSSAQIYDGGIILESVPLITKVMDKTGVEENRVFVGFGIFYSAKWSIDSSYQIELRPGYSGGQDFYTTLQLGVIVRRKFGSHFFGSFELFGVLQGGDNTKYASHTLYSGFGIGRMINEELALILSIQKTINSYFGKNIESNVMSDVYCDWVIRLGIELNL